MKKLVIGSITIGLVVICMVIFFSPSMKINRCLDTVFEDTYDGYSDFKRDYFNQTSKTYIAYGDVYVDGATYRFKATIIYDTFTTQIFSLESEYGEYMIDFWDDSNQQYAVRSGSLVNFS